MIYYFSGTGNSKYVANKLGELMKDEVREIPCCEIDKDCESLGIVFPVYAWGLPKVIDEFIGSLRGVKAKYVWTVMTCGDDMGFADKVMRRGLVKNGLKLDAAFSVQMPNTYVCLPGFDIDSDDVARKKVEDTDKKLHLIAEKVGKKETTTDVHRGVMPFTKTYILRPLFNSTLVTDKYFKTNADCNKCGKCAKECPLKNIVLTDKAHSPEWKGLCTGCLRCYHQCPQHALHFGSMTNNKGQKKKI